MDLRSISLVKPCVAAAEPVVISVSCKGSPLVPTLRMSLGTKPANMAIYVANAKNGFAIRPDSGRKFGLFVNRGIAAIRTVACITLLSAVLTGAGAGLCPAFACSRMMAGGASAGTCHHPAAPAKQKNCPCQQFLATPVSSSTVQTQHETNLAVVARPLLGAHPFSPASANAKTAPEYPPDHLPSSTSVLLI